MSHTHRPSNHTSHPPPNTPGPSMHHALPNYAPPPPPHPIPGSLDPMKKRLLRAWDDNGEPISPSPTAPTAVPPPSKRRRYPKLLTTDKDGRLIANPLRIPTNTRPPAQHRTSLPSAPRSSPSPVFSNPSPTLANPISVIANSSPAVAKPSPVIVKPAPVGAKPPPIPARHRISFARSVTRPRRRMPRQRAMVVTGDAPLVLRPMFTDRNGETFSFVFRPKIPVRLPPNPLDDVFERPHVSEGMVQTVLEQKGGGGKSLARVVEGGGGKSLATGQGGEGGFATQQGQGEKSLTKWSEEVGGGQCCAKGQGVEQSVAKVQRGIEKSVSGEHDAVEKGVSTRQGRERNVARGRGGRGRTGRVFNPTAIAQRPVRGNVTMNGEGEEATVASDGRVIQVGRRSGTVHYWRSSLQMPKRNDKVLGAMQHIQDGKAEEGKADSSAGGIKLSGDVRSERWPPRESAERGGRRATGLDLGLGNEYPMEATTLAAEGLEKMIRAKVGSSTGFEVCSGGVFPTQPRTGMQVTTSMGSAGPVLPANVSRLQQVGGSSKDVYVKVEDIVDMNGMEAQKALEEERSEIRRLHLTKNYEIRKLEAYAESRYHVKMNLRGRHKLENWLSSEDPVASNSVLFIVLVLNLDRRLVSKEARDRREALAEMNNEHLRMLEALMARTSTRDGYTNWGVLTANFRGDPSA